MKVQLGLRAGTDVQWLTGYVEAPDMRTPVTATEEHAEFYARRDGAGAGLPSLGGIALTVGRSTTMTLRVLED